MTVVTRVTIGGTYRLGNKQKIATTPLLFLLILANSLDNRICFTSHSFYFPIRLGIEKYRNIFH